MVAATIEGFRAMNRFLLVTLAVGIALGIGGQGRAQTSALPSWNDGAVKDSITDFVARVTKQGGPDYVAPAERIATFDNERVSMKRRRAAGPSWT